MAIAILIVFVFVQNVMVVIAAVFISFGTGATDLCLGTGCRNNEPERFLVINSSIACKE
jgi:hypothetical protein